MKETVQDLGKKEWRGSNATGIKRETWDASTIRTKIDIEGGFIFLRAMQSEISRGTI